jgi:hypothetical protein
LEGFKKIIWRYGKLLKLDPETMEQSRLDVDRAQIAVTYWEMVDEVIEVKVDDEIFIIRMVEERFGGVDMGIHKQACSRTGVGESDGDSISTKQEGCSVMGIDEGWSENHSDEGLSVNGGRNQFGGMGEQDEPAVNIQGVENKGVSNIQEEGREVDFSIIPDKEGKKGLSQRSQHLMWM